mmetsp:Transcript_67050/g.160722  ORF Transcript_67050/g.160722 Transcript_67050/m.160722 type:complete len:385 (-) Transcript_67050:397-1551(-)
MELAGGLRKGDRVSVNGVMGTVLGPPARIVAAKLSVTVGYDDGTTADVRAANLTLVDETTAYAAVSEPVAPQAPYGIGNRILDDRYADKPLGGEIEAGYGIGNRILDDGNAAPPADYGYAEEYPPQGQSPLEERYNERPLPAEGYANMGTRDLEEPPYFDPMGQYGADEDATLMPPGAGQPPPPGPPAAGGGGGGGEEDQLSAALYSMDDALAECEGGLQVVQQAAEAGEIQDARTMLAQMEARAKSLEGALDGLPTMQLPNDDDRRDFKRELLQRLEQFFYHVDFLFKQLAPPPPAPPAPAAGAPSGSRPGTGSTRSTAQTFGLDAEPLAGDFRKGDRVTVGGELGTILGRPARAAAARLSVSVHFDAGHVSDVRAANIQLAS